MIEQKPESPLIEIGDPEVDAVVPTAAPAQVVIEYRDRGVPWMLMPPLLVAIAVVAVAGSSIIRDRMRSARDREQTALAVSPEAAKAPNLDDLDKISPHLPPQADAPVIDPDDLQFVENLKRTGVGTTEPGLADDPSSPAVEAVAPAPVDDRSPTIAQPPLPAHGLGFDPSALKADDAFAPASQEPRAVDQAPRGDGGKEGLEADQAGLPPEVDPDLLPPDPRVAQFDRKQRAIAARRRTEDERLEFHAKLAMMCKRFGAKASPQIDRLCQDYQANIDPGMKNQAAKLLGATGKYAGASRPVRINLLRSLGFPESAILLDIFDNEGRWVNHVSKGVGSRGDVLYRSATILLKYPPAQVAKSTPPADRSS